MGKASAEWQYLRDGEPYTSLIDNQFDATLKQTGASMGLGISWSLPHLRALRNPLEEES